MGKIVTRSCRQLVAAQKVVNNFAAFWHLNNLSGCIAIGSTVCLKGKGYRLGGINRVQNNVVIHHGVGRNKVVVFIRPALKMLILIVRGRPFRKSSQFVALKCVVGVMVAILELYLYCVEGLGGFIAAFVPCGDLQRLLGQLDRKVVRVDFFLQRNNFSIIHLIFQNATARIFNQGNAVCINTVALVYQNDIRRGAISSAGRTNARCSRILISS